MEKFKEIARAILVAVLIIACLLNVWLLVAVVALLFVAALVQSALRLGDNQTGNGRKS